MKTRLIMAIRRMARIAKERPGREAVFTVLLVVDIRRESRRYVVGVSKRVARPGGGVRPT